MLKAWFEEQGSSVPPMAWYEFACSGSTLGIFCLVANACHRECTAEMAGEIRDAHFPWVQGFAHPAGLLHRPGRRPPRGRPRLLFLLP